MRHSYPLLYRWLRTLFNRGREGCSQLSSFSDATEKACVFLGLCIDFLQCIRLCFFKGGGMVEFLSKLLLPLQSTWKLCPTIQWPSVGADQGWLQLRPSSDIGPSLPLSLPGALPISGHCSLELFPKKSKHKQGEKYLLMSLLSISLQTIRAPRCENPHLWTLRDSLWGPSYFLAVNFF